MVEFDVFTVDFNEARELLHRHYKDIGLYKWRWRDSEATGIPIYELNRFFRTGEIDRRRIPGLYIHVFGDKDPERVRREYGYDE